MFGIMAAVMAIIGTLALVAVATLYWDDILNWFRARNDLKARDRDAVAFTLQQKLKSGKFRTVQGIFNTRTSTLGPVRGIESTDVSPELMQHHRGSEVVIYE
jgi:hypothetical protein